MPNETDGSWGDLQQWPLIGLHAIVTQDGKVLTFGTDSRGMQGGQFIYDVFDPETGTHTTLPNTTPTDIFCSAAIILPGTNQILIAGGDARGEGGPVNAGIDDVNIFNSDDYSLTPSDTGDMTYQRWYPTMVSLASGQVVIIGGTNKQKQGVGVPEIYTPGEGWRALDGAADADIAASPLYTRAWVNTSGTITYVSTGRGRDSDIEVMTLDPSGNGSVQETGTLPFAYDWSSPSIMYETGKVLLMASNGQLWTMDINGSTPVFSQTERLSQDRNWSDMTVLADGSVLVNGGTSNGNREASADTTAAIWDPDTGQLTYGADEDQPRLYHSATVLLADGSVLSLGGGAAGSAENNYLDGQIYRPPYLYDDDGSLATRPVVSGAPEEVEPGESFTLTVDDASAIANLTFVKSGAATHSFNMEARMTDLSFTVVNATTIEVTLPDNPHEIVAGNWMLFAWNTDGVPARAPIIAVQPTAPEYDGIGDITAEYFSIAPGVTSLDQINFDGTADFSERLVTIEESTTGALFSGGPADNVAVKYTGSFEVGVSGSYTYHLTSDDGARLFIDGAEVIDNDGLHGPQERSASVQLDTGIHTIELRYFEATGGATIDLDWAGPNFARTQATFDGGDGALPPTEGVVFDDPNAVQTLTGVGASDTFVIAGVSSDYGWGDTEDGLGTVVWNDSSYDLLFDFETLRFADQDVSIAPQTGTVFYDQPGTQTITGTDAEETFVINAASTGYDWGPTNDGTGTVVWNASGYDLLFDIEKIQFSDQTITLDNSTGPKRVLDNPLKNQFVAGSDGVDQFVIDAQSADYGWGTTRDGADHVVWNDFGYDVLYDFEEVVFNDTTIQLDQIA